VDAVQQGRATADEAIAAAEAIDHEPALARASWSAGRLRLRDGDPTAAETHLRRALALAHEVGDMLLAAAITTDLVYAVSRDRDRAAEADDLATEAAAMLAAAGDPPVLGARLRSHRASAIAHARDGDTDAAVVLHEEAVALPVQALGATHPDAIVALGNLGTALNYAGRPAEAEARLGEAIAAAERVWGAEHPRTAVLVGTLGFARMRQGDLEGARIHLRRSLEIREATLGPDHGEVDSARYNLASVLRRLNRHGEAVALLQAGLANRRRELGPDEPGLGPWLVALGESKLALGDDAAAQDHLGAALRTFERSGATAGDYARVRLSLARAWSRDDTVRARVLAEAARSDAVEADAASRLAEIDAFLARTSHSR
jgi:tetratricopeptide (TPR) repeat protein